MAKSKTQINVVFALLSAGLLITTIMAAVRYEGQIIRPSNRNAASGTSLPENHPSVDMTQTLAELIRLSQEDPQSAGIQAQIGNIYYDMGEYDQAVVAYGKSLDIQPNQASVETDLATCFHYLGKDDEALKRFDHVLTYSPGFVQAMYNKGVVLIYGKNDIEGGRRTWEKLLQMDLEPAKRAEIEKSLQQLKASIR
jgi:tetratricopeptide (TPR) repeat protein